MQILDLLGMYFDAAVKVSKNQNDFMKTSFLPNTNEIIVRISAHYITGQNSW